MSDGAGEDRLEPMISAPRRRSGRASGELLSRRAIAALLDLAAIAVPTLLIAMTTAAIGRGSVWPVFVLALVPAWIIYDAWFAGGRTQATPGHQLLGLEVVSSDGAGVGRLQACVWSLVFIAGIAISGGFTLLFPLLDRERRAANDVLAGVRVRRRGVVGARASLAEQPP